MCIQLYSTLGYNTFFVWLLSSRIFAKASKLQVNTCLLHALHSVHMHPPQPTEYINSNKIPGPYMHVGHLGSDDSRIPASAHV